MSYRSGKVAKGSRLAHIDRHLQKDETLNESTPTKRPESPKGWK